MLIRPRRVGADGEHGARRFDGQTDAAALSLGAQALRGLPHEVAKVDALKLVGRPVGFGSGQIQQLRDHGGQAVDLTVDTAQEIRAQLRIVHGAGLQRVNEGPERT